MKSVLVLFDSGNTSKTAVESAFEDQQDLKIAGISVHLELIGELEQWHQIIKAAPFDYDAIIVGLYQTLVNSNGDHIPEDVVLSWTSKNTRIPLFAFWDFAVGKGKTVGGFVLFGKIQGEEAAKIAQRILGGEKAGSIRPKIADQGRFYFSDSELKRWSLSLPDNIKERAVIID